MLPRGGNTSTEFLDGWAYMQKTGGLELLKYEVQCRG